MSRTISRSSGTRLFRSLAAFSIVAGALTIGTPASGTHRGSNADHRGASASRARDRLPDFDVRRMDGGRPDAAQVRSAGTAGRGATVRFDGTTGGVRRLFVDDGYLTQPRTGDPSDVLGGYLGQHQDLFALSPDEIATFETVGRDRDAASGVTHLYLDQRIHGLQVFGSLIKGHVDSQGRLVSVEASYYPGTSDPGEASALSPEQALIAALRASLPEELAKAVATQQPASPSEDSSVQMNGPSVAFPSVTRPSSGPDRSTVFAPGPFSAPIPVREVLFPTTSGTVLAWRVDVSALGRPAAYTVVVDARSGELLYRANRIRDAGNSKASVFAKNPNATPLAVKKFRGDPTLSPHGWSSGPATMGNNVQGDSATPLSGNDFIYPFTDAWKTTGPNSFDLAGKRLRFTPTDSMAHSYVMTTAAADSTAAAATNLLPFFTNTDDGTINLICGGGWTANILGATFTSFFVNTNGSVSFGSGITDAFPSKVSFSNGARRVAGMWRDLNPGGGGSLTGDCAAEGGGTRIRIVWNATPNFPAAGSHTFAIVVHGVGTGLDNVIDINYGAISSPTGELVGVGGNSGTPFDPATAGIVNYRNLSAASVSGIAGSTPNGIAQTFPDQDLNLSITNLAYQANVMHDVFQGLGFDEVSGNYQLQNFGKGGAPKDPVQAEAQYGVGVFNSSFFQATPDGTPALLATGAFSTGPCRRDSAFDASLVRHEYTHGVSSRMVNGPSDVNSLGSFQGSAIGEGWSDAFATSTLNDPVLGAYTVCDPDGMRSAPYDEIDATYADFGNTKGPFAAGIGSVFTPDVHSDGEIWGAVGWDMHTVLHEPTSRRLLFEAMRYTPLEPTMVDARDSIFIADLVLFGGSNRNQLLGIFAKRGLGTSASSSEGSFDAVPLLSGWQTTVFAASDSPATRYATPPQKNVYRIDFENGTTGWTTAGVDGAGGQTLWHLSTRRASSGTHAFWYWKEATGNYTTGFRNYGSIISPQIQLPSVNSKQALALEWDQFRTTGDAFFFDGGFVRIIEVGSGDRIQVAFVQNTQNSSGSFAFEHQKVNLSQFAGKKIQVEFFMDTFDAIANSAEGWYVDNVKISRLAPPPSISINDVSHPEGDGGTKPFTFVIKLSASTTVPVRVKYRTANGTAHAPSDYTALPLKALKFNPGQTTKTVTVLVKGDTTHEANESFFVNLSSPKNATIGDGKGKGTIVNDD